jgi:hypothetical protein
MKTRNIMHQEKNEYYNEKEKKKKLTIKRLKRKKGLEIVAKEKALKSRTK